MCVSMYIRIFNNVWLYHWAYTSLFDVHVLTELYQNLMYVKYVFIVYLSYVYVHCSVTQ